MGHAISNLALGVGQSFLCRREGVGHVFFINHISKCSGPPLPILFDQSLIIRVGNNYCPKADIFGRQSLAITVLVVQSFDSTITQIKIYSVDNATGFRNNYPLDYYLQSGISLNLRTGPTGHAPLFNQWDGALVFINKQIKTSPQSSKSFKTINGRSRTELKMSLQYSSRFHI